MPGPGTLASARLVAQTELLERVLEGLLELASRSIVPLAVLLAGLVLGLLVGRLVVRLLLGMGASDAVEGTSFERAVQRVGTSTVGLIGLIATLFVWLVTVGLALELADVLETRLFLPGVTGYLREVFLAVIIVIVGFVVGDKAEIAVRESLRGVKLPEVALVPAVVKYSIFFVAGLLALAQLEVATAALLVVLGGYAFALVFLGGLALWDLLRAAAAGVYLLLAQPYGIGDRVELDGHRGIVQEVNVLVTHVENEGEELIVPNHLVFKSGVVRIRS